MPVVSLKTALPSQQVLVPTNLPSGMPHPCSNMSHYDAIFADANRMTYFLSGKYYWRVHESDRYDGPFVINQNWPKLPAEGGIEAAYQSGDNTTFFKGKEYALF